MDPLQRICDSFPFSTVLSFEPLLDFWRLRRKDSNPNVALQATQVVDLIKATPELQGEITDWSVLDRNKDALEVLMQAVFSEATWPDDVKGIVAPFQTDCFYETPKFREIVTAFRESFLSFTEKQHQEKAYYQNLYAYAFVLERFYGKKLNLQISMTFPTVEKATGLLRYYKGNMNPQFVEIRLKGELPALTDDDIGEMLNRYDDIPFWREKLPAELFEFVGISIMDLSDITDQQMISAIKEQLLADDALIGSEKFAELLAHFRSLVGIPSLSVGVACYQKSNNKMVNFGQGLSLAKLNEFQCASSISGNTHYLSGVYNGRKPLVLSNVSESTIDLESKTWMEQNEIRSAIFVPLEIGEELIGILEIGADKPNALTSLDILRLQELNVVMALAVKRSLDQLNNQIVQVIKDKFTSLHEAVEWKFEEVATKYIEDRAKNRHAKIDPIIFDQVYPLFGSSDIRNSSEERNTCIQADLNTQLSLIRTILGKIIAKYPYPIYKEIDFEVNTHAQRIKDNLLSEDEVVITDMIHADIEPLFKHLMEVDKALKPDIQSYFDALDSEHGMIYDKRKDFADTVAEINNMVYSLIETEEEKTQEMFPYYFENYKTDGVEYNIYIGQSLTNKRQFNPIYLYNLRLWQLMLMCKITRETNKLSPKLPIPLETAQLILVQSSPLAIKFRTDEKKFDVDGAYNIRYEIMKKRIDKATIRGTQERLTQPGTVAVIYSNQKEEEEYLDYFKYLAHLNYINPKPQKFELEYLQGISGLKAFRLEVNLATDEEIDESFQKEMMEIAGQTYVKP